MQIIIKTKNLDLTDSLNSFVNKKIGGLKKFLGAFEGHQTPVAGTRDLFDTFVEVEKETRHHRKGQIFRAEVKIYVPGKSLFASAMGDDLMKVISQVRDEMEREIRKYKTKIIEFPRRKLKKSKHPNF